MNTKTTNGAKRVWSLAPSRRSEFDEQFRRRFDGRQGSWIGVALGRGVSRSSGGWGSVFGLEIRFEVPYFQAPTDRGPGSWIGVAFDLYAPKDGVFRVNGPGRGLSCGRTCNFCPNIITWFGPGSTAVPSGKLSEDGGQAQTLAVARAK